MCSEDLLKRVSQKQKLNKTILYDRQLVINSTGKGMKLKFLSSKYWPDCEVNFPCGETVIS